MSRRTVMVFAAKHPALRPALAEWCAIVENANWTNLEELRQTLPASGLGDKRVKFKVHGNDYRLIVDIRYADPSQGFNGIVKVQFIGTHAEYDKIDARRITHDP